MVVELDDNTKYSIDFQHDPVEVDTRITRCCIYELTGTREQPSRVLLAEGFAICHPEDTFTRERGRKISLTRALEKLFPYTGDTFNDALYRCGRRTFWEVYLNRKGNKNA